VRSNLAVQIDDNRDTDKGPLRYGRYLTRAILIAAMMVLAANAGAGDAKQIVGATEIIEIEPSKLRIEARIDTGAQTTSIHAENIEIDVHGDPRGKPISFDLVNKQGQRQRINTQVAKQLRVNTSEGGELRYVVPLTLSWRKTSKTLLVNLNDRAHMRHRLLLGRNWLRGDYIVDVELNDAD
jgi:hypothetical protein